MCITPMSPIAHRAGGKVTWLKSQWKLSAYPAHFCVEIYSLVNGSNGPLSLQVFLYGNGEAILTKGCRSWLKFDRLRVACEGSVEGSLTLSVNRQAILTPYRHPKMTPIGALGSWPDAV